VEPRPVFLRVPEVILELLIQLSALVLKATERRTAISGLMPAHPLTMLDSAFRLTPSDARRP